MSEYVVVWDGTMGSLTNSDGWQTRGSYLLDAAPGHREFITVKESAAVPMPATVEHTRPKHWHRQGSVGRPLTSDNRTRVCQCGRRKAIDAKRCSGCRENRKQRKVAA